MTLSVTADARDAMPPMLQAEHLRMSYGERLALRDLTFSLRAGRILGFLGPNGAGKTTAIRILTTMLAPTSGTFTIEGVGADRPEEIRRRIGVLPEQLGFPRQMTGHEYLVYFGRLYGLSRDAAGHRADGLLADVGLTQRGSSRIDSYSRGMRQRLGIARALVNEPSVVFLDEPTLGLDPRGQQELLDLVLRIARERSAAIVLCSHLLSEIEGICDEVVILNLGQVVAAGPVSEVLGGEGGNVIQIRIAPSAAVAARDALGGVRGVKQVSVTDEETGRLSVEILEGEADAATIRNALIEALLAAGVPVMSFGLAGNRLQDLFLQVTDEAIS
jgi:ABC-2 type transport system ATP-binding protein